MPQSHSRILIHLVFSTKNREPFIGSAYRERTFNYLGGALNGIGCPVIRVGGTDDHVHLLFALGRTISVAKVVEEVKKESSKWAKGVLSPKFYWQHGYGAFSVSPSNVDKVVAYIDDQERHHRKRSFKTNSARSIVGTGSNGTNVSFETDLAASPSGWSKLG